MAARALLAALLLALPPGAGGAQTGTGAATGAAAAPLEPQDALRPALSAQVVFTDPAGAALTEIRPGETFAIELTFTAVTGALPEALRPQGWIREKGASDLPCGETAAAYRATGRGPMGSVDLNGMVLGVLGAEGSFVIVDPRRSIGSANLLAARRVAPEARIAADPETGRFYVAAAGRLSAIAPQGDETELAAGLGPILAMEPASGGGVWLLEGGSGDLLRLGGSAPLRLPLHAHALAVEAGGRIALLTGEELLVREADGAERLRVPVAGARAVALSRDAALVLSPDGLRVVWLDAPQAPQHIPLPGAFDRLAVSPEGRMAILFSRARTGLSVVDLALGRVVQSAGTAAPVAEVAFLRDTAFLRLADNRVIGAMDLRGVVPGGEAVITETRLGQGATAPEGARLLVPFLPEPVMLAVDPALAGGFLLDRRNALTGRPPMEALRIRGAPAPQAVAALDRGFREIAPGRFRTLARLPRGGDWDLVVSTGAGQMSFCQALPAPPALPQDAGTPQAPGTIVAERDPGAPHILRFRLTTATGAPAAGLSGELDLRRLGGNGHQRTAFVTDATGLTLAGYDLGSRQVVVVTARTAGPLRFAPLIAETPR